LSLLRPAPWKLFPYLHLQLEYYSVVIHKVI